MNNTENNLSMPKWVSWIFLIFIAILLFNTMDVATPFLIGAIIAWFLNLYAEFLEKIGLKRNLAVPISFGSCLILIITAILFIIPPLTNQVVQITSNIKTSIKEIHKAGLIAEQNKSGSKNLKTKETKNEVEKIEKAFYTFLHGLYEKFPVLKENIQEEEVINYLISKQQEISNFIVTFINNAISNISSFLSHILNIILIPIFTFYFLVLMKPLKERINYILNKSPYASYIKNISENIVQVLENYIKGMFISSTLFGVTVGIGSYILSLFFHTKYSLVIGCVAIFLSVIPYIGMFLISIIAALIVYFTSGGNLIACIIMILMLQVINFTFDNYISPKIVGDSIGIHPLVSMFAMLAGGKLFGFWGLILGSPCAGILKIFMTKLYPTLFEEIPSSATTTEEKEAKEQETKNKKTEDKKQETKDKETEDEKQETKDKKIEAKEQETKDKETEDEKQEAKDKEIEVKEQETKDKKAEDEKQETKDKEAREEETPRKKKSKKNKK